MHYKLAFVALFVFLSGCLIAPSQKSILLPYTEGSFTVEGCYPAGNFQIEIWASRPATNTTAAAERKVTTVRTGTTAAWTEVYEGGQTSWYCFSKRIRIPADMWAQVHDQPLYTAYVNAFFPDSNGILLPFYTYNNDPDECPLPVGWSQITGDTNGDGWPEPGAELCALQTNWIEVTSF